MDIHRNGKSVLDYVICNFKTQNRNPQNRGEKQLRSHATRNSNKRYSKNIRRGGKNQRAETQRDRGLDRKGIKMYKEKLKEREERQEDIQEE